MDRFGARRIYYNNFSAHLLNAYNPNLLHPGLPHVWTGDDWRSALNMVADFGFNVWEFWLVPRLFCREALQSDFGEAFISQINAAIEHAHTSGLRVEMLCALATVGSDWRTLCPNEAEDWRELRYLWDRWTREMPGVDIVGIFPGDPGACSRNGCTAETFIDKACEIGELVTGNLPRAEVEIHTWGSPFFGWGLIQCPPGWKGEFIGTAQGTAWRFDKPRADNAMRHLLHRLQDMPSSTSVAINMGFNPDGEPEGDQDARHWAREIAQTHPIYSWDFSLTEGENNVVPHYRFDRLFAQRRKERAAAPYSGGICYTMSPMLNQLSLWEAAHSFVDPDADPDRLAGDLYESLFGAAGRDLVPYLPLFEVVKDWGNYHHIDLSREEYHRRMSDLADRLRAIDGQERDERPFFPAPNQYRKELLYFAELFAALSDSSPDYDALHRSYWQRVYQIYDLLPEHVDPRPRAATERLIQHFSGKTCLDSVVPGKWVD